MKNLIVYFSRDGENYVSGALKELKFGNTKKVVGIIQKFITSDVFEVKMKKPYSNKYEVCINEAQKDQKNGVRPEITEFINNINDYDVIYLGYPNYWGSMPMAISTFLEHYDFKGKIIKPFCTHEGSGLGHSIIDLHKECPTANIKNGLAIHGSTIDDSINDIKNWVEE